MPDCKQVFYIPIANQKGNSNFIHIEHKATEWCSQENDSSTKVMSVLGSGCEVLRGKEGCSSD